MPLRKFLASMARLVALAVLAAPLAALPRAPAEIHSASVDAGLTRLTLDGRNFLGLLVFLGGHAAPLVVESMTGTRTVALLPAGLSPGTHVASVGDGRGRDEATIAVAIGVQGPAGAAGPAGTTGQAAGTSTYLPTPYPVFPTLTAAPPLQLVTVGSGPADLLLGFTSNARLQSTVAGCTVEYRVWVDSEGLLEPRIVQYLPPPGAHGFVTTSQSATVAVHDVPAGVRQVRIHAASPCSPDAIIDEMSITSLVLKR